MTYDDDVDTRPSPFIADTSMDRIADESIEDADADIEEAREAEKIKNQNILAMVSKNLGKKVKDSEIQYMPQSTASSSAVNPNPVVKSGDQSDAETDVGIFGADDLSTEEFQKRWKYIFHARDDPNFWEKKWKYNSR